MSQKFNFSLGLHQEGFFRFDNLDGHIALRFSIDSPHHLTKRSLPDALLDNVATIEHFATRDNVIIILVIPAVVVRSVTFVCLLGGSRRSSSISFLIVYFVDILIRVDERHRQFDKRSIRR
jgi:hypothetical protein